MEEPKKMGRPKVEDPKTNRVEIKLNSKELEKLDNLSVKLNKTRSEVIRLLIAKEK